jgi:alkyl sulfatase BDS1-like metallo-beta-lactamase superfamily hydrolase
VVSFSLTYKNDFPILHSRKRKFLSNDIKQALGLSLDKLLPSGKREEKMLILLKLQKTGLVITTILAFLVGISGAVLGQSANSAVPKDDLLKNHCDDIVNPRIEKVSEHVWVALGFDLANEILIQTEEGIVIIDPLMKLERAAAARKELLKNVSGGGVKSIIYTHSHIDHIGGASLWAKDNPPIWATEGFKDNFFKQYQVYLPIESIRGKRQYGYHVSYDNLPCNGIGRRVNLNTEDVASGIRLPTQTFSGIKILNIGGVVIELIEAHGETDDQLFVWLPQDRTLIAADNFYAAFPNLYTIRGTSPRPVDQWIKSIDAMRKLTPEHLVPCHTLPIHGAQNIAATLTDYRDAIQWVRDEVIREANKGHDLDTIAENIKLPVHLADKDFLREFYGQVDWSVRGIYTSNLGWFDGRPDRLYPIKAQEGAGREIALMGGTEKVLALADESLQAGDLKWAIHLLAKLADSGLGTVDQKKMLSEKLALSYERLALTINNSNGRGYLLESAFELRNTVETQTQFTPKLDNALVVSIPLDIIFSIMATRLITEKAMDVYETVHFVFPDEQKRFIVTVRRGIAEISEGEALPGTPDPVAVLTVDALTFRKMALKMSSPIKALASGRIQVQGSWLGFLKWYGRFDRD